jgi:Fe-S-cluster containining protein
MAADRPSEVSLYQEMDQASLSLDSRFKFHCHAGLSCFNQCCRTPTVILSPYDILRLQQGLGLSSGELLARYTRLEIEDWSRLPLVFIDPYRSPEAGCPFLGERGCLVYAFRPAACRFFPITMGSQATGEGIVDYYFCRQLDYCQGFHAEVEWTVASWKSHQGLKEYEEGRQGWLEILLQKGLRGPVPGEDQVVDLFAALAYDLEQFRRYLSGPEMLLPDAFKSLDRKEIMQDDLALLHFSYRYFRLLLLGEDAGASGRP